MSPVESSRGREVSLKATHAGTSPWSSGAGVGLVGYYSGSKRSPSLSRGSAVSRIIDLLPPGLGGIFSPNQGKRPLGLLGFLPQMVARSGENSPIALACRAIATALISNLSRTAEAQSQRVLDYGKALTAANAALGDRTLQTQDETLTCVWLLSLYEVIVGPSAPLERSGSTSWFVHTQGLADLLRLRGTSRFSSPVARNLFWLAYNTVQIQSFVNGVECPSESIAWFEALEKYIDNDDMHLHRESVYGYHASKICANGRKLIDGGHIDSLESVLDILNVVALLDTESYDTQIPRVSLSGSDANANSSEEAPFNLRAFISRTSYCSFRLKMHITLLELLNALKLRFPGVQPDEVQERQRYYTAIVQALADEILEGVPFFFPSSDSPLGGARGGTRRWTDGLRLLWPLRLVAFWPFTRDDQRRLAQSELQRIRAECGFVKVKAAFTVPSTG
ncbi:hypothetical protein A1O1_06411 [Capronia coronata CBS 617.96]|uniref:Transcription factor domain-containing protein n=1 Tax=Capronia coronata CBS 617.96 TaxID=1182541 RepID=W9XZQ8_9EURO|nr:uncharacterized protein A1O1_06411 [Capronia coronata CBS 617.96]EXJ86042.1 hypothetical protein A1O1_06411 [Capronia coronata CBS 617.96]